MNKRISNLIVLIAGIAAMAFALASVAQAHTYPIMVRIQDCRGSG